MSGILNVGCVPVDNILRKLRHHLRDEGISGTIGAVAGRLRKTTANGLEGTPGYHALRLRLLHRRYDPEDLAPIWVSPDEITSLTGGYERRESGHLDYVPRFKPKEARWESLPYEAEVPYGAVRAGEWDREREPFSKLLMYRGVQERFEQGFDWEETAYYRGLRDRFASESRSESRSKELAMDRCERLETVYETIRSEGYRSQRALNGNPLHEITVNVARDGELLYNCEGRHRLSVAKVLGVDRIPVLRLVSHPEHDGGTGNE